MFANTSDKIAKRQWLLAICVFGGIIIFVALIQMMCSMRKSPEEIINGSEGLRTHDRICLELPQPHDFKLKRKGIGGNSHTTAISYSFWTGQPFGYLKAFYKQEFEARGWEMTDVDERDDIRLIAFRKENFRISIQYEGFKTANYYMYCSKVLR